MNNRPIGPAVDCPICRAKRKKLCRDEGGQPCWTHQRRVEREAGLSREREAV